MSDKLITCNRGCGNTELVWKIVNGKYKLFSWNDQLVHICNDGVEAPKKLREKTTFKILNDLDLREVREIPDAETNFTKELKRIDKENSIKASIDASKCFTINCTASGISLTGDDKHNAIYLPKVAVPELIKALIDFV